MKRVQDAATTATITSAVYRGERKYYKNKTEPSYSS